jgi:hypothetical protein
MEKKSQAPKHENFQNLPESPLNPSPEERAKNKWSTDIYGDEILVLPLNSIRQAMTFMIKNKAFVYPYVLDVIARGIEKNRDRVQYLELGVTAHVIEVTKANLDMSLEAMIKFFVKEEMYEEAARATKLLDKHRVNMLLESI